MNLLESFSDSDKSFVTQQLAQLRLERESVCHQRKVFLLELVEVNAMVLQEQVSFFEGWIIDESFEDLEGRIRKAGRKLVIPDTICNLIRHILVVNEQSVSVVQQELVEIFL